MSNTHQYQHYHSGEYRDLEEISDPHTWKDETVSTAGEWVSDHPILGALIAIVGLLVLAVLALILQNFGSAILQSFWFKLGVGLTATHATVYYVARTGQRKAFEDLDWLVLPTPDGVKRYLGHYRESNQGDHPLFVPVRGFSRLGSRAEPYEIGQLSKELKRSYRAMNRDATDTAVIRLHPSMSRVAQTDTGLTVAQLSGGLSLDPTGRESNLVATLPEIADEGALLDLKEELQSEREHQQFLRKRLADVKEQRDEAMTEARDTLRESVEWFSDQYAHMREAETPNRTRGANGDVPTDQSFDDVEAELRDDDE